MKPNDTMRMRSRGCLPPRGAEAADDGAPELVDAEPRRVEHDAGASAERREPLALEPDAVEHGRARLLAAGLIVVLSGCGRRVC